MDTGPFDWVDDDLYTKTTIIHWPSAGVSKPVDRCSPAGPAPGGERAFLQSSIRDERAAFQKLHQVPGWQSQLMNAFGRTRDLLADHGVALPDSATEEVIAYVANAWTRPGNGLFDRVTECNATIALDLALTQVVLVRTAGAIRASAPLRGQLAFLFQERFPRSWAFVNALEQS
jgi:hypothetical protein